MLPHRSPGKRAGVSGGERRRVCAGRAGGAGRRPPSPPGNAQRKGKPEPRGSWASPASRRDRVRASRAGPPGPRSRFPKDAAPPCKREKAGRGGKPSAHGPGSRGATRSHSERPAIPALSVIMRILAGSRRIDYTKNILSIRYFFPSPSCLYRVFMRFSSCLQVHRGKNDEGKRRTGCAASARRRRASSPVHAEA